MKDFVNAVTCSGEELKRETAKDLLGEMDGILREMEAQVSMISDALYRGRSLVENGNNKEPCEAPPMVITMQEQRDTAERLLQEIIKIREVLW